MTVETQRRTRAQSCGKDSKESCPKLRTSGAGTDRCSSGITLLGGRRGRVVLSRAVMLWTRWGDAVLLKNPSLTTPNPKLGGRAGRLVLPIEYWPHFASFWGLLEAPGILLKDWAVPNWTASATAAGTFDTTDPPSGGCFWLFVVGYQNVERRESWPVLVLVTCSGKVSEKPFPHQVFGNCCSLLMVLWKINKLKTNKTTKINTWLKQAFPGLAFSSCAGYWIQWKLHRKFYMQHWENNANSMFDGLLHCN